MNEKGWKKTFIYRNQEIRYNRIPVNNCSERAVEVPLAFDFLAALKDKSRILEIGNVLAYYENVLSEYLGISSRRIVDKFEKNIDVDNIDLMDLPSTEKYNSIISISTVEHIGQGTEPSGSYGEKIEKRDLEAPLKAIAKIYDLLVPGGAALITVPCGKLIDFEWYIQFSSDYLHLLFSKYDISQQAISISYLKRLFLEPPIANPLQFWAEVPTNRMQDVDYNWPWPCANGIAVIELTKIQSDFTLKLDLAPTELLYGTTEKKPVFYLDLVKDEFLQTFRSLKEINLIFFPDWLQSEEAILLNLEKVLRAIFHHPDSQHIQLFIETGDIDEEQAELALSSCIMNICTEADLEISEMCEVNLLTKLTSVQWDALVTRLHFRLVEENILNVLDNESAKIPSLTINAFNQKRAIMLPTGLWDLQ